MMMIAQTDEAPDNEHERNTLKSCSAITRQRQIPVKVYRDPKDLHAGICTNPQNSAWGMNRMIDLSDWCSRCMVCARLMHKKNTGKDCDKRENNNDNGNFICVFECTIVNLATYRQFTNAAWDWIIKKKKTKNKTKQKPKKKKEIKIALSLGYPSSYFYNKRCNMLL